MGRSVEKTQKGENCQDSRWELEKDGHLFVCKLQPEASGHVTGKGSLKGDLKNGRNREKKEQGRIRKKKAVSIDKKIKKGTVRREESLDTGGGNGANLFKDLRSSKALVEREAGKVIEPTQPPKVMTSQPIGWGGEKGVYLCEDRREKICETFQRAGSQS